MTVLTITYQALPTLSRKQPRRFSQLIGVVLCSLIAFGMAPVTSAGPALIKPADFESHSVRMEDVSSGTLLFANEASTENYQAAITQTSEVEMLVTGMVAKVRLKQRFVNHTDKWQEGTYVFPMPDDAAINGMRIQIGERVIEGKIKERKQAEKIYRRAKASGRKASLVSQQRPNMFTNSVANIGPGEAVVVELEYLQAVVYQAGVFSLRFPMTITPRYMPGDLLSDDSAERTININGATGWAANTTQVPDASLISPPQMPVNAQGDTGNRIRISGRVDAGLPMQAIDSAYHRLALNRSGNSYEFSLAEGSVVMQQDFVLNWRPSTGDAPSAAAFMEVDGKQSYAMLMLVPPQLTPGSSSRYLSKEQVFIIDTSGSMGGTSIVQARESLLLALDQLKPGDFFNIVEFNSAARAFSNSSVAANSENIRRAKRMVNSLQANGGTEMLSALGLAMNSGRVDVDSERVRQLVFITDGAVGNEAEVFRLIQTKLASDRLFTVGIGSAPNTHFMRKASQFGRGSFTHIGDTAEVREKMAGLLAKLSEPLISDIRVEWPAGMAVESYPAAIPDLYAGEPLQLSSRLGKSIKAGSAFEVKVTGRTAQQTWSRVLQLSHSDRSSADDQNKGLATLWARRKINSLLDSRITGANEEQIKPKVLQLALEHKLLSPYTSFVAVEKKRSRPKTETLGSKALPNAKPKGQTPQQFAYPQGSAGATLSALWGTVLLILFTIIRFAIRQEQNDA